MATRRTRAALASLLWATALAGVGYWIGDGYIARLSDHRGFFSVAVDDVVERAPNVRPRRATVVVVDGLRGDVAREMAAMRSLADRGHCVATDVGALTISRPVYAALSTGLEVDRTGARNNDNKSPLAAQSIWQVARAAGRRVHAASDVAYWRELFPDGFDRYVIDAERQEVVFDLVEPADLTLYHASYPDAAGHDFGAASPQYRDAVARTDRELIGWLEGVDLARDLVVVTADHGHVDIGGHGGPDPSIRVVWSCFAGPGIDVHSQLDALDVRTIAPTLAILLALPLPANLRAGDDDLDSIWELVDRGALGEDYVGARRRSIEHARERNHQQLVDWLGRAQASWPQLYRRERNRQLRAAIIAMVIIAALLVLALWVRGYRRRRLLASMLWMALVVAVGCSMYALFRGGFDFTSINLRVIFLTTSIVAVGLTALLLSAVHLWLWRDLSALTYELVCLASALVAVGLAHRFVYGVPLGFPLPGSFELFLPFMDAAFAVVLGGAAALLSLARLIVGMRPRA